MKNGQRENVELPRPRQIRSGWFSWGAILGVFFVCPLVLLLLLLLSAGANVYWLWELSGVEVALEKSTPAVIFATPTLDIDEITLPPAPTSTPMPVPTITALEPTPTPTPHPLADFTIDGLRARKYPGGTITIRSVLTTTATFTSYYIDYPSDGLTITGVMQIPKGEGSFPVVVLNHGYIAPEDYRPGSDTWRAAGYLNKAGYLTIAPDFRGWGESDAGNSFFSTGQVIDTLNAISSLSSIPQADTERIGVWGHSMGGGIALKAVTVDPRIKAAVLYAPVSANDAEILERWGPGCSDSQLYKLAEACGGAEAVSQTIEPKLFMAYANAIYNPDFLAQVSPINYVDLIAAPVQIHVGTADTRTPPAWAASIYETLVNAGKPATYYTYPQQQHAFKDESWTLFMERTVIFFDNYLRAGTLACDHSADSECGS